MNEALVVLDAGEGRLAVCPRCAGQVSIRSCSVWVLLDDLAVLTPWRCDQDHHGWVTRADLLVVTPHHNTLHVARPVPPGTTFRYARSGERSPVWVYVGREPGPNEHQVYWWWPVDDAPENDPIEACAPWWRLAWWHARRDKGPWMGPLSSPSPEPSPEETS